MMLKKNSGITLIELLVAIAIVVVLTSLTTVAVQSARESSRCILCQVRNRELAMAMMQKIDSSKVLPENRFIPSLKKVELWSLDTQVSMGLVSRKNASENITHAALTCPSSLSPSRLAPISVGLGGEILDGGFAETVDYVANAGVYSLRGIGEQPLTFKNRVGVVPDVFNTLPKRRLAEIRGGLSHTFACWEFSGAKARNRHPNGTEIVSEWDQEFSSLTIRCDSDYSETIRLDDNGTLLKLLPSSIGLMRGYIGLFNQFREPINDPSDFTPIHSYQVINVSNRHQGPYSPHPNVCNFAFLDGSARSIAQNCDHLVAMSYATACADIAE